jgi:ABC-type multidrug transport system ATPase subunit
MGMNGTLYWAITYLFNYTLYALVCIVFVCAQLILKAKLFAQTDPLILFLLLFEWGHTVVAASFLISTFFSRSTHAMVFGYVIVILSVVVSVVLCMNIFDADTTPPAWFWIYPFFCFYRVVYVIFSKCMDNQCISSYNRTWQYEDIGQAFWCLAIETVIILILAWYFNKVIPQEFGVASHPLFFMIDPIKKLYYIFKSSTRLHKVETKFETCNDPGVLQHEKEVLSGMHDHKPLIIRQLGKRYSRGKIAVKNVTLAVAKGKCLGLLGPNGAGKTSLMNVLYGLFPPTYGSAMIAGFSITDVESVQRHIGVSMQFDVLWDNLTVTEHLNFYALVKRVVNVREHVSDLIDAVSLNEKRNVYASELSGGMKRRLSLAISMIGTPSVIFLDEPTTGLDPSSKREVWDCISLFQRDRAIVITTHDMDEASIICSEFGVLNESELVFYGTQSDLRTKFQGENWHKLEIVFLENCRDSIYEYVINLIGQDQCVIDTSDQQKNTISFGLTPNVKMSKLWKSMRSVEARDCGVLEFALGQISLETLFMKLMKVTKHDNVQHNTVWRQIRKCLMNCSKGLRSCKVHDVEKSKNDVNKSDSIVDDLSNPTQPVS